MTLKITEPWPLLREHRLGRYTFERDDCSHSVSHTVGSMALFAGTLSLKIKRWPLIWVNDDSAKDAI